MFSMCCSNLEASWLLKENRPQGNTYSTQYPLFEHANCEQGTQLFSSWPGAKKLNHFSQVLFQVQASVTEFGSAKHGVIFS